jgi:molybdate transport system substrate-binding protein
VGTTALATKPWTRWRLFGVAMLIIALLLTAGVQLTVAQERVVVTVAAASDLTPAFEELGTLFTEQTGIGVEFTFGSTGQLTQQIEAGAPVDVFAAASIDYIDQLEAQDLIIPDTKARYALGRIVLWTLPESTLPIDSVADLTNPEIEHIAIANPDHAPYGVAAREAMRQAGIWEELQPKLVLGENVRDTLRYAETGDVDVAIVALSLAIQGTGRWTLIPNDQHEPIDQALAVIADTQHEAEARAFADFINSEQGREVMRRYGFVLPGEAIPDGTPAATAGVGAPGTPTP